MSKIALISCTKLKQNEKCKAKDMYLPSSLFRKARNYVEKQGYDQWFILSAKYGLLNPIDIIDPYDLTLNNMSANKIKEWSADVFKDLLETNPTHVDFYTGEKYRKYLIPLLEEVNITFNIPLKGLGIGQQMKFYNENGGIK